MYSLAPVEVFLIFVGHFCVSDKIFRGSFEAFTDCRGTLGCLTSRAKALSELNVRQAGWSIFWQHFEGDGFSARWVPGHSTMAQVEAAMHTMRISRASR